MVHYFPENGRTCSAISARLDADGTGLDPDVRDAIAALKKD
jgi:hypothetical protein